MQCQMYKYYKKYTGENVFSVKGIDVSWNGVKSESDGSVSIRRIEETGRRRRRRKECWFYSVCSRVSMDG